VQGGLRLSKQACSGVPLKTGATMYNQDFFVVESGEFSGILYT
jgi:hypothetical protein